MTTDKDSTFKLTLKGEGVDISKNIDSTLARHVITLVLGGSISPSEREKPDDRMAPENIRSKGAKLSMREYIDGTGAKRYPDKIVSIAQYLADYEGKGSVTKEDIKLGFRTAREAPPSNFHRDWDVALKNGWVAEEGTDAGTFYVTHTGKQAVESNFSEENKKGIRVRRRSRDSGKDRAKDSGKARTKVSGGYTFRRVPDLDLKPKGKESFVDFVSDKSPQSNEDKYAVVVYYLEQVLELNGITLDHIGTVFRIVPGWREPNNLSGGVRMAASRKNTIDTADLKNIKTTPTGRNFVEHDLVSKAKS